MQMMITGQILPFHSPFGHTDGTRASPVTVDVPTKSHLGVGITNIDSIEFNIKRGRGQA